MTQPIQMYNVWYFDDANEMKRKIVPEQDLKDTVYTLSVTDNRSWVEIEHAEDGEINDNTDDNTGGSTVLAGNIS